MAIGDISLTGAMRNTLVSLQDTSKLMDRTQERLSTGKKVNSALDNPANFFAAQAHTSRANILDSRKDSMNEAIQTIKVADKGVKGITTLVENLRGILSQARSYVGNAAADATKDAALDDLETQYAEVISQIDSLVTDSNYKGTNLISSATADALTVVFNEDNTSSLGLDAVDLTANAGLGLTAAPTFASTDAQSALDAFETELNDALSTLRTSSAALSSNLSIIQTRIDFTTDMVNSLTEGANKLTIADTNEEGANMLMLQTRQQLGTTALSLASQAAQSVLRLF